MRRLMQAIGVVLALALVAGLALWWAVRSNGPAVVDRIDRIAGPRSATKLVAVGRYGADPAQKVRLYAEAGTRADARLPVFVFAHGGAWAHGDPDDYGFIARSIAPAGYLVALVGYRLNEGGRYPAMLQDTAAAIRWVRDHARTHGGDPDRLVLSGHSAGAYNVVQVALEPRWLAEAGVPQTSIRGVVGLSGPYDFYPFETDRSKNAFGSVGAGPASQPVNHARADAPPMLLVHGAADTTVRIRNTVALDKALTAAGAKVDTLVMPGEEHNAPLLALVHPWRRDPAVRDAVLAFVARVTRVSPAVQGPTP